VEKMEGAKGKISKIEAKTVSLVGKCGKCGRSFEADGLLNLALRVETNKRFKYGRLSSI
jgi:hypothetical protein